MLMRLSRSATLVAAAAATAALLLASSGAHAQQAPRPVIGLLGSGTAAAQSEWTAALLQRLRELGWSEGGNLTIEYRWPINMRVYKHDLVFHVSEDGEIFENASN